MLRWVGQALRGHLQREEKAGKLAYIPVQACKSVDDTATTRDNCGLTQTVELSAECPVPTIAPTHRLQ